MVTGQTFGQYVGRAGRHLDGRVSLLASCFGILAAWAAMTIVLSLAWIPFVAPIKDAASPVSSNSSLAEAPGRSWLPCSLATQACSAGGATSLPGCKRLVLVIFLVPMLMMLAGFGMVVGGIIGGRITDRWRHAGTAALGQSISCIGLLLVVLLPGNHALPRC